MIRTPQEALDAAAQLCDEATAEYSRKMAEPGGLSAWAQMNAKREAATELAAAIRALSAQIAPPADVAGLLARLRNDYEDLSRIDLAAECIEAQAREIAALTAKLEAAEAKVERLGDAAQSEYTLRPDLQAILDGARNAPQWDMHKDRLKITAPDRLDAFEAQAREIGGGNG